MTNKLENINNWRDAVCTIVDEKTRNKQCISSGEITKEIRENRPDLKFSHWDIGEFLRDLYYSGSIRYFNDQFGMSGYSQAIRITEGKTRTPKGTTVFVYGPSFTEAMAHDFEVEIPRSKADANATYDAYGTAVGEQIETPNNGHLVATVHADNRLCIPRSAFDALMQKTGKNLSFGDRVHISLDDIVKKIKVKFDADPNSKAYDLTRDRGRVKYTPDVDYGWVAGDSYEVQITDEGLEINVNEPIGA